jgi:elongation factor P
MATTADIRNGMVMMYSSEPWLVVEFQHVKPGKGNAFVRTRLKNVKTGRVQDVTFRSGEKVEEIRVERRKMQYLYKAADIFYLMDLETYDQLAVTSDVIGEAAKYLKESEEITVATSGTEVFAVAPPMFVTLEVTETEPGFKGDTASAGTKGATLETGLVVQVPLFIEKGDVVRIDTRDGRYVERVSRG